MIFDTIINFMSLALFAVILFLAFNASPGDFVKLFEKKKNGVSREEISLAKLENIVGRKPGLFEKFESEAIEVLNQGSYKISFEAFKRMVLVLSVTGFLAGVLMQNIILALVLALGFLYLPLQILKFIYSDKIKIMNEVLKNSLSIVTNAYLQHENVSFVKALKDNLDRIEEPVRSIFEDFIYEVEFINPNMVSALRNMKKKINNKSFWQWCDLVIKSQQNRNVKFGLPSYITNMSEKKVIQAEVDTITMKPRFNYLAAVIIDICVNFYYMLINRDWYNSLTGTLDGKILIAVDCAVIISTAIYVINETKPVSSY